jgi:hypothetical protein
VAVEGEEEGDMITRLQFEGEMRRADMMLKFGDHAAFWAGYIRGLRRGFHGEKFGNPEEHHRWWEAFGDPDETRCEMGRGYRGGFRWATLGPRYCSRNFFGCESCSLVNYGRDCRNNPVGEGGQL